MFTVPHPRDDWDVQLLVTCLPARAVGQDRTTNIVAKFDGLTAHCDKQLLWWDFMSQLLSREENIVDYNPVCMCIDDAFTAIANWTRQISKTILIFMRKIFTWKIFDAGRGLHFNLHKYLIPNLEYSTGHCIFSFDPVLGLKHDWLVLSWVHYWVEIMIVTEEVLNNITVTCPATDQTESHSHLIY